MQLVYIINNDGTPLMPTQRCGMVRKLLKQGKARVVRKEPFIIKLDFQIENAKVQELVLGVDTGSSIAGTTVVSKDKNEVYYVGEVTVRNDIQSAMTMRAKFRNQRRRKKKYRKPRFNNRKNSKRKNRVMPSVLSKVESHIREIEFIKKILPISEMSIEAGNFDTTLLDNKDKPFNRSWGYQKGPNYGYENARHACYARDNYTCQCCKTRKCTMNAHHIKPTSQGGRDHLDNLITLCEKCHRELHAGLLPAFENKLGKGLYKKNELKHATQTNIICSQLFKKYPQAKKTFGYITKINREYIGLEKGHWQDAVVIAMGDCVDKPMFKTDVVFIKRHIAKGFYKLYSNTAPYYKYNHQKIDGKKKGDKVEYFGKEYFLQGIRTNGVCTLVDIYSKEQSFSHLKWGYQTPKITRVKRVQARNTTLGTRCKIS